jgi:hypothetical protein
MLKFENGKNNGGFTLWGTDDSLRELRAVLMDVSEKSPVLNFEGLLPALAYDIRHAYDGMRKKSTGRSGGDEISLYGVDQLWPTFIVQVALLRTGLAFIDTTKHQQGHAYLLEDVLEQAIKTCFPAESAAILFQYQSLIGVQEQFLTNTIGSRVSFFATLTRKKRQDLLVPILASLAPMWEHSFEIFNKGNENFPVTPSSLSKHSWDTLKDFQI